jgi:hypothetical protein
MQFENHPKAHTHTHRCFDVGMPENISVHNKLKKKKVRIKWPQLGEDKDTHKKHTQ